VSFRFQINFLLGFRELLYLIFDALNTLNDSAQLIPGNIDRCTHCLLLTGEPSKSAIDVTVSRRVRERGKQPINGCPPQFGPCATTSAGGAICFASGTRSRIRCTIPRRSLIGFDVAPVDRPLQSAVRATGPE